MVGLIDDTRGLGVAPKLLAQLIVAVFAYWCGFRIDSVLLPFIGPLPMGAAALPLTVLWIVGVTNAVNLLDGLDGLAAGVVFFAGISNLVVALVARRCPGCRGRDAVATARGEDATARGPHMKLRAAKAKKKRGRI